MPNVFYLDYVNGDDANDGSSWALAWKTFTNGATAVRIAPGDIIRIAKSPDPTAIGNATWTNLSNTVTLASALTVNIELCETAWTPSTYVTATTSTTRKQGSYSASLAIASAFTTGKIAYKALAGAIDLSAYQQVSFWIRSSVAKAAGVFTLRLCSDTIGNVAVNTIAVPAIPGAARFQIVTVDTGGALGNSIQSVALYAEVDPVTPTILLDNVLACKASSSPDSLTLSSLISKNSTAQGGIEGFYGIKSINGTTLVIDQDTNMPPGVYGVYSGMTETVASYKRETIKTVVVASLTTVVQGVQDSGTLIGGNIQFQGGYNTVTSEQDGETFFDGSNGMGYGISVASKSYVTLNLLSVVRYNYGICFDSSNDNTILIISNATNNNRGISFLYSSRIIIGTISNVNNNNGDGLYISAGYGYTITTISSACGNSDSGVRIISCYNSTIATISNAIGNMGYAGVTLSDTYNIIIGTISHADNNDGNGVSFDVSLTTSRSCNNIIANIENANNNYGSGVIFTSSHNNVITAISHADNNDGNGVSFRVSYNNIIKSLSTTGNLGSGVANDIGINYIRNALMAEELPVYSSSAFTDSRIFSWNHNRITGNHWIFTDSGIINSQTAVRRTASGIAWKLAITSPDRLVSYPLKLKIAEIAVNADWTVTVKAWLKKDHAMDVGAKLVCPGGQLSGIPNDISATKANDTDWEQVQITFNPTEAGVLKIEVWAYYISGMSNIYVDDFSVSQV